MYHMVTQGGNARNRMYHESHTASHVARSLCGGLPEETQSTSYSTDTDGTQETLLQKQHHASVHCTAPLSAGLQLQQECLANWAAIWAAHGRSRVIFGGQTT